MWSHIMKLHKKRQTLIFTILFAMTVMYSCDRDSPKEQQIHSSPPFVKEALDEWNSWGSWGEVERCPNGEFAYSFRIRYESYQGSCHWTLGCDDTGANALELACTTEKGTRPDTKYIIRSKSGVFGNRATKWHDCEEGSYLYSYQTAIEPPTKTIKFFNLTQLGTDAPENILNAAKLILGFNKRGTDDTSLNGVRFECKKLKDNSIESIESVPLFEKYSIFGERAVCDDGKYISGIQTRVERKQGRSGDDTALNDIKLYCTTAH